MLFEYRKIKIVIYIVLLYILVKPEYTFSLTSITVSEPVGILRKNEPVTSGIPLPESANIISTDQLMLNDENGNLIPAQYKAASRWGGTPDDISKPIKWVFLNFQSNVSANESQVYYLKEKPINFENNADKAKLSVIEDYDKFIVNTGKAKFQISKHYFNLFDYVWIDSDSDGIINNLIISQPFDGGVLLKDINCKEFTALLDKPEEIVIEEKGELKTIIKIRGCLKSSDGTWFAPSINNSAKGFFQPYPNSFVYYNCRLYFYNNSDFVRIFFTLENNGANGRTNPEQYFAPEQMVYFDSIELVLKTNLGLAAKLHSHECSIDMKSSDIYTLYQDWNENLTDSVKDTLEPGFVNGIFYESKKNGELISQGLTNPGWIDLSGKNKGIGLAIRHFWQNFPKKITINNGNIKIGLWPEEGYYPYCASKDFPDAQYDSYCRKAGKDGESYLFDAGRHKTYEIGIRFYGGEYDNKTPLMSASLEYPLAAIAPPEWYSQSFALGVVAPANVKSDDSEISEAIQRFEQRNSAMVYEEDSDNGLTILNLKTTPSPHWEHTLQNRFYNWMNFGDLLWSGQSPSALHYDWTYIMLLHYIRTGKRNFFDAGVEMAKHRYDIDQYHGERYNLNSSGSSTKWINYMAFYESSGHADPCLHPSHPSKVSANSHTWNGGLLLYYLLTGDQKAIEAAEENVKAAMNHYGTEGLFSAETQKPAQHETRMETWPILNLINMYRISGNKEQLRVAKNIAKNRLLVREKAAGGQGYFGSGDGNEISDKTQSSVMWMYAIEAMINIHYETEDEELKELLIRMAEFTKENLIFGGEFNQEGKYLPIQNNWVWHKNDPDGMQKYSSVIGKSIGELEENFYDIKKYYDSSTAQATLWADLFTYVFFLTGDIDYFTQARKCFKDAMFYYAAGGRNLTTKEGKIVLNSGYLNTDSRSKISFIDGMFPNSHTKIHGWLGRTNQFYLFMEWVVPEEGITLNWAL